MSRDARHLNARGGLSFSITLTSIRRSNLFNLSTSEARATDWCLGLDGILPGAVPSDSSDPPRNYSQIIDSHIRQEPRETHLLTRGMHWCFFETSGPILNHVITLRLVFQMMLIKKTSNFVYNLTRDEVASRLHPKLRVMYPSTNPSTNLHFDSTPATVSFPSRATKTLGMCP
jgi:hypothetical protein